MRVFVNFRLFAYLIMSVVISAAAVLSLTTVYWYTGNGIVIGLASNCPDYVVVDLEGNVLHFCTSFAFDQLQDGLETSIGIMCFLACVSAFAATVFLGLTILFRSMQVLALLFTFMFVALQLCVLVMFPANYNWTMPYSTHMGSSYLVAIVGVACGIAQVVSLRLKPITTVAGRNPTYL